MNLLKIKHFDKGFSIDAGRIYSINLESRKLYLTFMDSLMSGDKDYFVYSEDLKPVDFDKKSICITDVFGIDPNSRKILNSLYKRINSMSSVSDKEKLDRINGEIIGMLDRFSMDMGTKMRFDIDLDIIKILGLYKFEFENENADLVGKLITYIKANMEIMDLKFVFFVNVLPLICEEEFDTFQKEMEMLGLALINVNYVNKFVNRKIEYVTVDADLCEF